jgi:antagonist of KipI
MSTVRVLKPGLLTTVQDRGRWGLQAFGVSVAGPMDPCSHRVANAIVGNDPDAAALEVTLVGPALQFDDERVVAVAGAEFELTLNGAPVSCNTSFVVPSGATLRFGQRIKGTRAYLGVAGGIDVPPTLGSRSTHVVTKIGGLNGRQLRAGDQLPLGRPPSLAEQTRSSARRVPRFDVAGAAEPPIRILPGPQADRFASDALELLQSAPYTVGSASDRMGFRLEGPALTHSRGADIISDATPLGALQVPASGRPILLMADRQTTGGYPKIATVISADISRAGQLGPGHRLSFVVCSPREAMAALIAQERALMALEGPSAL